LAVRALRREIVVVQCNKGFFIERNRQKTTPRNSEKWLRKRSSLIKL
jgi:hypothetical protein